jgi:hypothetical protein
MNDEINMDEFEAFEQWLQDNNYYYDKTYSVWISMDNLSSHTSDEVIMLYRKAIGKQD